MLGLKNQSSYGRQYVLIGIPAGTVRIENISELLLNRLKTTLAFKDVALISAESEDLPLVELNLDSITLSALDYFFTRKIICNLNGKIIFRGTEPFDIFYSEFATFPSEEQFKWVLDKCIDQVADKITDSIHLRY